MYNGTVLLSSFLSQNVLKSCFLLPNVSSAEPRKIELLSNNSNLNSLFCSFSRTYAQARTLMLARVT